MVLDRNIYSNENGVLMKKEELIARLSQIRSFISHTNREEYVTRWRLARNCLSKLIDELKEE